MSSKKENVTTNTTNTLMKGEATMKENTLSTISTFATDINSMLSEILNRESKAVTVKEGETEVITLTVKLAHKLASGAETLTITNPETISVVERLQKLGDIEAITPSIKCVELARIADDVESETGMKIDTFAYSVFGISKKTALQYVRIGRYFYNESGGMKSGKLPFLNTAQIIPLLARLVEGENPLQWIEEAFTPNEDGKSLLHGTDSARDISKALKAFDSGMLNINGVCEKTEEELQAIKAQRKAERKADSSKDDSKEDVENTESMTPIESFNFTLGNLVTLTQSLTSSFKESVAAGHFGEKAESISTHIAAIASEISSIADLIG